MCGANARCYSRAGFTFDGSLRGTIYHHPSPNPPRGASKPDGYRLGFGMWSGTSFSAPALAGEYAAQLAASGAHQQAAPDPDARRKHLAEVVEKVLADTHGLER